MDFLPLIFLASRMLLPSQASLHWHFTGGFAQFVVELARGEGLSLWAIFWLQLGVQFVHVCTYEFDYSNIVCVYIIYTVYIFTMYIYIYYVWYIHIRNIYNTVIWVCLGWCWCWIRHLEVYYSGHLPGLHGAFCDLGIYCHFVWRLELSIDIAQTYIIYTY